MKKIFLIFLLSIMTIVSCKKDSFTNPPMASLAIVNAVVGGKTVRLGSININVGNNFSGPMTVPAGISDLYVWPLGDSSHPYYTQAKFNAENRKSYSLFLGGTSSAVDGILVKDEIPYHVDSTWGVRFVNMCPNSTGFNITLKATPSVTEVSNLQYKQYTEFKVYPAKAANASYQFQIRKASDNSLLFTYNLNTIRFANVTLTIRGLVAGSPGPGVTISVNDRF